MESSRKSLTRGVFAAFAVAFLALLAILLVPARGAPGSEYSAKAQPLVSTSPPAKPKPPVVEKVPSVEQVLASGVLIVISKPTQKMFVFKDGKAWGTSPVSTGKPGYSTPSGVFPVLQKRVFHRSNRYSNAPMPYMQRLTWKGVAIHAGHLPGYPASHGCIRLPRPFAVSLYGITAIGRTTVVISSERLVSEQQALDHARRRSGSAVASPPEQSAAAEKSVPWITPLPVIAPTPGPVQTIQLAAAGSPQEADALWTSLVERQPALAALQKAIIPATVDRRRVFRLRASGAGAHDFCSRLKVAGIACFNVR